MGKKSELCVWLSASGNLERFGKKRRKRREEEFKDTPFDGNPVLVANFAV